MAKSNMSKVLVKSSMSKSEALKRKTGNGHMKEGIHRVGNNPSRFVHRDPKAAYDLYESWKGGKQTFRKTTNKLTSLKGFGEGDPKKD